MLPIRRLLGLALLLAVASASAGAASATAQADTGIVTAGHPALRGSISRRLPHPTVAPTTNETAPSNMTTAAIDGTDEPRTGALEWAGQAAAAAPPPNDNAVTASAPMGNQGQSLTDQDTGILPFGGGILNEPSLDDAEPEAMAALNTTAPTPAPTHCQCRREL